MSIIERKQFSDLLDMRYVSDTLRYTLYVGNFEIAYIAYIRN